MTRANVFCGLTLAVTIMACQQPATAVAPPAPSPASPTTTTPDRWEYLTFAPPDIVYDETLNRLGADGWELVTARRARSIVGEMAYEITLRRRWRSDLHPTTAEEQTRLAFDAASDKRRRLRMAEERVSQEEAASVRPAAPPTETLAESAGRGTPVREIPRGSFAAQVFIDQATHTYFDETCPRPARAIRVAKAIAVKQGYGPAPSCTASDHKNAD